MADLRDVAARPDVAFERRLATALLTELLAAAERSPALATRRAPRASEQDVMATHLDRHRLAERRRATKRTPTWRTLSCD